MQQQWEIIILTHNFRTKTDITARYQFVQGGFETGTLVFQVERELAKFNNLNRIDSSNIAIKYLNV